MLQEIWQEILNLKQDKQFTRNLIVVFIITIASSLILAEQYRHPARLAQQQRLTQFYNLVSVGMVIRTYDTLLNKE
ncbi:MAG: hypothetical protein QNJ70_32100 [Xenococcaceae cyanobacterium MO_207.B15]|nr:hypothetical protein [Xenococcaceae cyanobacterium MO_207.B15]